MHLLVLEVRQDPAELLLGLRRPVLLLADDRELHTAFGGGEDVAPLDDVGNRGEDLGRDLLREVSIGRERLDDLAEPARKKEEVCQFLDTMKQLVQRFWKADLLNGDGLLAGAPGVVIGRRADQRVRDLGLAGELSLRDGRHWEGRIG